MAEPLEMVAAGNIEFAPGIELDSKESRGGSAVGGGKKESSEAGTRRIVAAAKVLRSKLRLGVPPPEPEPEEASLGCRGILSSGQPVCDSLEGCLFSEAPFTRLAFGESSS